ncbi:MAG TPA: response regulator transcription factor [Firmicutes bacterium]|nr:response regulator transcription factor [Bacillota bacterium]
MPKILVVDDSKTIRLMMETGLKKEGFDIITAVDGEDGLIKAFTENPDLIVLDVMMPKLNGFQVCRKIKRDERTLHIPVLILTAQNQKEEILEGFNAGADEYLCKPFKFDELLKQVKTLLKLYGGKDG